MRKQLLEIFKEIETDKISFTNVEELEQEVDSFIQSEDYRQKAIESVLDEISELLDSKYIYM